MAELAAHIEHLGQDILDAEEEHAAALVRVAPVEWATMRDRTIATRSRRISQRAFHRSTSEISSTWVQILGSWAWRSQSWPSTFDKR